MVKIWGGDITDAIRDFLVEATFNAFEHGKATEIRVVVQGVFIDLWDNGRRFRSEELRDAPNTRGGSAATRVLYQVCADKFLIFSMRIGEENRTTLSMINRAKDIEAITDCHVTLDFNQSPAELRREIESKPNCNTVYVIFDEYASFSHAVRLSRDFGLNFQASDFKHRDRQIVFVSNHLSKGVVDFLRKEMPDVKIMNLKPY